MNYEEFKDYVLKYAKNEIGEEGKVCINHVIKNNGTELDGLVIMLNSKNVSPTIYLEAFYNEYISGVNIDTIIECIMTLYNNSMDKMDIKIDFFDDFMKVKNLIAYKVINYEQNVKLLETLPHKRILDLAVVFYCIIKDESIGNATVLIHNSHLSTWNITLDELYKVALDNTPKLLECRITRMSDIIMELFNESDIKADEDEILHIINNEDEPCDMYVMTNADKINGAACMFYDDKLSDFADKMDSDVYILPSSIHEVILIPAISQINKNQLENMVREVNIDGVAPEEILSDNVYVYSRADRMITL